MPYYTCHYTYEAPAPPEADIIGLEMALGTAKKRVLDNVFSKTSCVVCREI